MATRNDADEVFDALRGLFRSGLDLGVTDAVRRLEALVGPDGERDAERALASDAFATVVAAIRAEPQGVLQLVKEVWSRGGSKERQVAAHALGYAIAKLAPHRALGLSRELAAMARNEKEADLVGREAIAPLIESNPPFLDRVKLFLQENEPWIRRAAIAGIVAYVARKRKYTAAGLEAILLLADRHEAEIKSAVRQAVRDLSEVDWKATAKALSEWAKADPTGGRLKLAKQYAGAAATGARAEVQKFVFQQLAKIAEAPVARAR